MFEVIDSLSNRAILYILQLMCHQDQIYTCIKFKIRAFFIITLRIPNVQSKVANRRLDPCYSIFSLDRCLSFCTFSFDHRVVCSSLIYEFWLPLWYLLRQYNEQRKATNVSWYPQRYYKECSNLELYTCIYLILMTHQL
jgi:hypothetical protein